MIPVTVVHRVLDDAHLAAMNTRPVPADRPAGPTLSAPGIVVDGDTGEPILAMTRWDSDQMTLGELRRAVLRFPMGSTVRAGGIHNESQVFGFFPRAPVLRRMACSACAAAAAAPEAHATICRAAGPLFAMYRAALPRADADLAGAEQDTLPEWRLGATPWTSGVVNKTSPLPYHRDDNNVPGRWSAMVTLRRATAGGQLHIPGYGLRVACRDGDVLFFAGWGNLHGVTPIMVLPGGYRFTVVYYPVGGMRRCLPFAEEMAEASRRRTAAADGLIDRQRAAGHLAP